MILLVFLPFLLFIASIPFLLRYTVYHFTDKSAGRILQNMPADARYEMNDTDILFKGLDKLKRDKPQGKYPLRPLYTYNMADLLVFDGELVVIGKVKVYGKLRRLTPFSIFRDNGSGLAARVPSYVKYKDTQMVGDDVEIRFEDPEYTSIITLVVKNGGKDLYNRMR